MDRLIEGPAFAPLPPGVPPARKQPSALSKIVRNALHLMSGSASSALLGVLTLAILARALGPASLGILVMVDAYARLVDQLVRLETWQAVVRFGTAALEKADAARLRRLVKFGTMLDLGGALAASIVAFILAPLAARLLHWDANTVRLAELASIALVLRASSTPTGVLQLFGRFPIIAWSDATTACARLVATAAVWALDGPLIAYFLVMILAPGVQRTVVALVAWRELRRRGHGAFLKAPLRGLTTENHGLWSLIWSANATVLVRKSTQELDALIVGSLLGPAAAGIYHIARRLGQAMAKLGAALQQAAFPEVARAWHRGDRRAFARLIRHVELLTAGVALVGLSIAALNASLIVSLIAGPGFGDAVVPLVIQMGAVFLFLCGSSLRPALMSMGLQLRMLGAVGISAVVFYIVMWVAVPRLGVAGASLAHLAFNATWLPLASVLFLHGLRSEAVDPPAPRG